MHSTLILIRCHSYQQQGLIIDMWGMFSISNTFTQPYHVNRNDMVCEQVVDEWRLFFNWSAAHSCSQLYCFGASPSVMSRCQILVPGEGDGQVNDDHVSCVRSTLIMSHSNSEGGRAGELLPSVLLLLEAWEIRFSLDHQFSHCLMPERDMQFSAWLSCHC